LVLDHAADLDDEGVDESAALDAQAMSCRPAVGDVVISVFRGPNVGTDPTMTQGSDRIVIVLGVVAGIYALTMLMVGIYALFRGRILARDRAAFGSSDAFGWYSTTLGLAVLLTSVALVLGGGWLALSLVALVVAAAGFYQVLRLGRRS
jgi:hypothetical protein